MNPPMAEARLDNAQAIDTPAIDTLARLRAGQLRGARRLDLRGCDLAEVPTELFALASTLEVLDLSGNSLQFLPEAFAGLQRLRILFCSDNHFAELPAVLGRCTALDIVGFKANRIARVPASALAPSLRWLILTDNAIAELPESLGDCSGLRKLMLAGNRLRRLPARLADCRKLELVRLAANQFERAEDALPDGLLALPHLAWLAHAGNPFSQAQEAAAEQAGGAAVIDWSALQLHEVLGNGASGVIHAATWQRAGQPAQAVAVKLFKGAMTSDGLPRSEMAACLAAGSHPFIVGVAGKMGEHPDGLQGLVLQRITPDFRNLAGPPSLASCTRDVYADTLRLSADQAVAIARGIGSALTHLHDRGLAHGDLYGHNILVDERGHSLLGDFGAASFLPAGDDRRGAALKRIDSCALGVLVDELAQRCDDPVALRALRPGAG
jgi:hypothetical protein